MLVRGRRKTAVAPDLVGNGNRFLFAGGFTAEKRCGFPSGTLSTRFDGFLLGQSSRKNRGFSASSVPFGPLWNKIGTGKGARSMFRGNGSNCTLGICAVALGCGILIAVLFPVGALLFLVAFLLIACGCACIKH